MELYEYEREHRDLLRRLAPECMVLLKSDGTFPLEAPCKVASMAAAPGRPSRAAPAPAT